MFFPAPQPTAKTRAPKRRNRRGANERAAPLAQSSTKVFPANEQGAREASRARYAPFFCSRRTPPIAGGGAQTGESIMRSKRRSSPSGSFAPSPPNTFKPL